VVVAVGSQRLLDGAAEGGSLLLVREEAAVVVVVVGSQLPVRGEAEEVEEEVVVVKEEEGRALTGPLMRQCPQLRQLQRFKLGRLVCPRLSRLAICQ
jgi:hypothetical protein